MLQNDVNSKGHTQWFYFRVANTRRGMKVKFNMLNMIKSKSLYNDGMKVLVYSQKRQEMVEEEPGLSDEERKARQGWHRGGEDFGYYQNHYRREGFSGHAPSNFQQRCYSTFTFTYTFEHDHDVVYFAYSQPYTYTQLTEYLCEIQSRQLNFVSRNLLCRTIAGNKCEYLTITNRVPYEVDKKKQGVIITGRIHPGESNSSWMMKGVIDFLVSNEPEAVELRDKFVFKIVPMLNPDGVINGNYRCSLAGCDLNRRWKYPSEALHPTVFHTKALIKKLGAERPLALYCDLHGHSRRKNIFMYGNSNVDCQEAPRAFPFLMSKLAQPHFSYDYSRFSTCRSKEQTARIAVWRDLGSVLPNIFTMEASFCGPKPVKYEPHRKKTPLTHELNYHFITADYEDVGKSLCMTLLQYRQASEKPDGLKEIMKAVEQYHVEKEARLEQDELIRQQLLLVEQRKAAEMANKARTDMRNSMNSNGFTSDADKNENTAEASAPKKKEQDKQQASNNATARKLVRKIKSDANTCAVLDEVLAREADKVAEECASDVKEKKPKKLNYNARDKNDESDALSDSEPSEDNLDEGEMMKIIPKKFGKKKFLKGVEEKKKKAAPPPEPKKKVEKKPKTELMPCLQSKRKELDEKKREAKEKEEQLAKQATVKKVASISKPVLHTKRNGVHVRDVATQIKYTGDGTQLSLMEIDIMNHTGCRWSRIIFPGFKGYLKPQDKHDMHKSAGLVSPTGARDGLAASFNAELSRLVGDGLRKEMRSHSKKPVATMQDMPVVHEAPEKSKALSAKKESHPLNRVGDLLSDQKVSTSQFFSAAGATSHPLGGTGRAVQPFAPSSAGADSKLNSLQQRILDGNFAEPRSLIGGFSVAPGAKPRGLRQNAFEYGSAGTSKGKPGDLCIKATTKFEQPNTRRFEGDLETVHEKAADRSTVDLLTGGDIVGDDIGKHYATKDDKFKRSNVSTKRGASLTNTPGHQVKKMVNGSLVTQLASSVLTNSVFVKSQQKQEPVRLRSKVSSIGSAQLMSLSASANQQKSGSVSSTNKGAAMQGTAFGLEAKSSFTSVAQ